MKNHVEVISSGLTLEEIEEVKDYFYQRRRYEIEEEYGREGWSYEPLKYLGLYKNGEEEQYKHIDPRALPLLKVLTKCEDYFLKNYEMKWQFSYKRGFLNCMEKGASLGSHSDDEDIYGGKVAEEVHYSALLFLTGPDEYEGGKVFFWDRETDQDIAKLKPNVGDLVIFKGSTMHGVEEILSGERINYVIFYRDYNPEETVVMDNEQFFAKKKEVYLEESLASPENR